MDRRYLSLSTWLKGLYGFPIRKVSVDAGLGCPNRPDRTGPGGCIYCNHRGSGTGASLETPSISAQLRRGMGFISSRYKTSHFIAYFQSYTNTYGPLDQLERLYLEALSFPEVVGLAIGTRPDCVSDQVIDLLAKLNSEKLIWVELGLQSMHDRTLRLINRGHDFSVFAEATARLMEKGLNVVAHLILGLPGESLSDMIKTARAVSDLGVSGVKLHPLYVVRGSGLEQLYVQGLYEPMTMEQTTGVTLEVVRHIDPKVVIHRLTSDPHREELLAPEWMLDRKAVRAFLDSEMDRTDFRQGSAL